MTTEKESGADPFDIPKKGDEIQKLSVVENLPKLINLDSYAAFNKIIPKIQQELVHSSSEFNITTSHIFQILIESHFKTEGNITSTVLQGLDSRDPVVANAWLETLLQVILILPLRVVQTEILPLSILKGQCSQSVASRVTSCKILGKIVLHPQMKALEIKKDILPVVYSLCQDINYTVRAAICEQIPAIARGLGTGMVKNFLLSNLVELSSDDNSNVRAVAVSSVVQVLPYLDRDTKINTMVPLVMNLCKNAKMEEASSLVLAKDIGLLLTSLESCLGVQQADQLIQFYQQLAKRGLDARDLSVYNVDASQDVKGREYCASNFPAVMAFTLIMCPNSVNSLYDIFKSLTFDSYYMVRHTIAGNFHEVARILGPKNHIMKIEFVRLLRDEAEEVLNMLVPNISTTMLLFLNHGTLSQERTDAVSNEIGKAMLKCLGQLLKGYNWRLTTMFLKQLETLPLVFRSDQIHNEFTPQVVRCALLGRTKPVRSQSVRTLLYFLRWNAKLMQRTWLRDHLIHELGENKCCYTRHVFIDMCSHAAELFSNKYFKENFFQPLLKLSTDKVSTIRYSVVSFFPKLRKMIRLPADRKLLTLFEQVILSLEKNEKDRDVLANLVNKTKEMMSPVFNTVSEDIEMREKRLLEEEENVNKGKITFSTSIPYVGKQQHKGSVSVRNSQQLDAILTASRQSARSQSVNRDSKSNVSISSGSSTRSTSVPRPPAVIIQKEIIRDMTFLKQHFYIDAGVELPMEENTVSKIDDLTLTPQPIDEPISNQLENSPPLVKGDDISERFTDLTLDNADFSAESSTNMTDDVKVNMRRKKLDDKSKRRSHSEIPTAVLNSSLKHKRHSSVYFDSLTASSVANRRRSLNIHQKEFSKIPVILKNSESVDINRVVVEEKVREENEIKERDKKDAKKTATNHSNLPVPVRRGPK